MLLTYIRVLDSMTYNLPPLVACPGQTPWCRGEIPGQKRKCYACQGRWLLQRATLQSRYLFALDTEAFAEAMIQEIYRRYHSRSSKARTTDGRLLVRPHSSGDMFSPEYSAAWATVAAETREVCALFAYTRVWTTDWGLGAMRGLSDAGVYIWASQDPSHRKTPPWPRVASIVGSLDARPAPTCRKQLDPSITCAQCGICWDPTLNVTHVTFGVH